MKLEIEKVKRIYGNKQTIQTQLPIHGSDRTVFTTQYSVLITQY